VFVKSLVYYYYLLYFVFVEVNAAESKKAAQKAAMVKKSISVTTLPRYAVNPTLSNSHSIDFQSLRGKPSQLTELEVTKLCCICVVCYRSF
jgi:hypothetical protein